MTDSASATEASGPSRPVLIEVNTKPVKIDGPTATGLQVKEAAIDQGVKIQLDFHLTMLGEDGKEDPVADNEVVALRYGQKFFAVDGDDNS